MDVRMYMNNMLKLDVGIGLENGQYLYVEQLDNNSLLITSSLSSNASILTTTIGKWLFGILDIHSIWAIRWTIGVRDNVSS